MPETLTRKRSAAYHEAGHAVAAWRRGLPPLAHGLVVSDGGGAYFHGGMIWRLLLAPPDKARRSVLAAIEVFQAGGLAEYVLGGECEPMETAGRREIDRLMDCLMPGKWRITCRNLQRAYGCRPDELDDTPRALLLLLVFSTRDRARRRDTRQAAGAIDRIYRLAPATPREILGAYRTIRRRVLRSLKSPGMWNAVRDLADEVLATESVPPDRALDIMNAARMPVGGLPDGDLPIGRRAGKQRSA